MAMTKYQMCQALVSILMQVCYPKVSRACGLALQSCYRYPPNNTFNSTDHNRKHKPWRL